MSTSKNSIAGTASGIKRERLAKLRRYFVLSAFEQLPAKYQNQPYSLEALDALEEEFRKPVQGEFSYSIADANELAMGGRRIGAARRPPSETLMAMLDDVLPILLEGGPRSSRSVSRETLIKDLKALGIKSKRRRKAV